MNNEGLIELLRLIKEVNNIHDNNIKCDMIHHISAYGAYLYYTGEISNNDFTNAINCIKDDIEDRFYYEERNKYIDILLKNNGLLNNFFKKYLNIYWKYSFNDITDYINVDIEKEFNDFLKYVNCYKLYTLIKEKKQISNKSNILRHSICLDNREDSYIILRNKNKFHEYLDLSHEMAHVLENNLLSKYKRCFDSPYNVEILSITFNRMFIEYLFQNNKITKEEYNILLNNFEFNYYAFTRLSLFISDSIDFRDYSINDYDIAIFCEDEVINRSLTDYNYAIGRVAALKLFDEWEKDDFLFIRNIPNLVDDIYHLSIKELVNVFGNNEEILDNELSKNLIKK